MESNRRQRPQPDKQRRRQNGQAPPRGRPDGQARPAVRRTRPASQQPRRRRRRGKRTLHYLLLLIFVLSAGVILSLTVFFQIEEVTVTGGERYRPEEIIALSGIEVGENMLRLRANEIEAELLAAFPYLATVNVQRRFPPRVELVITQYYPEIAVMDERGELALLTLDGKVLERGDLLVPHYLPFVRGIALGDTQPGEGLGGAENPDNQERLVMLRYLFEAADEVGFLPITNVDVRDRLNMRILHEARLILELGSEADLHYKLTFLHHVIENEVEANAQARLDISNARDRRLIRRDGRVENGEFIPFEIAVPDVLFTHPNLEPEE